MDYMNEELNGIGRPIITLNKLSMKRFKGSDDMPLVTIFQADGGPDHNIKFLRSKLTGFAFFLASGADRVIFFRGASGESCRKTPINAIHLAPVKFYIDNGLATLAVLPHCVNTHKQTLSTPLHKAWS